MSEGPIVILGSGFAGAILARALAARGHAVRLVERDRHPRFALGESSTPLAAISLERLAARYDLPDLAALAAYGRWGRELPDVGRGLKRGFSFYAHRRGSPYRNGLGNEARLLVAASPDDEVADAHWVRAEVDAHLARTAAGEGVDLIEGCDVRTVERVGDGWRVRGRRAGRLVSIDAAFVVDATGTAGLLAREAGGPGRPPAGPSTGLVFGHFVDAGRFRDAAAGASFDDAPYPEERAAVHHLLEEGWLYVLPFDDGRLSAGFVIDRGHPDAADLLAAPPSDAWDSLLARYPTLRAQLAEARPVREVATVPALQRRLARASGPGWAALPHTFAFSSPLFSTGIAWSLVGVERLAAALTEIPAGAERRHALDRYDLLLATEADHLTRLVGPAYRHRSDFDAFTAWSALYFAAASFYEACQRLCDPPAPDGWAWTGFLGACDPEIRRGMEALGRDLARDDERRNGGSDRRERLERLAASHIARRDVGGWSVPARRRLYPVDLDALVRSGGRLGLTMAETRNRLPRLRAPELRGGSAP